MSELQNDLRAKVLIAEDDAIVALDLQGMVMRLGYDVVAIVDSGQAAVAAARRFQPEIILMDILLNGPIDGIETAREIHKSMDLPIIFCVASPDLSVLVRAKDISYASYIMKPINPESLATTIDTVLYKYKLEKRVQRAEENFRQLSDSCRIFQTFIENGVAFEWARDRDARARVGSAADIQGVMIDALEEALGKALDSVDLAKTGGRFAGVFSVGSKDGSTRSLFALGARRGDEEEIKGILIPLEGGS
jgi:CheY-like chemotaxis protein